MGKLSAEARHALPKSDFALPGGRYPVNDAGHAKAALARASEMENKGKLSASEAEKVRAKAHRVLGEGHWSKK